MNIRSLSLGGLPAACLSSRSTGSIVDHRASLMSKRKAVNVLRRTSTENNCPEFHMGRDGAGRVHRQVAGLGVEGERGVAVALQRSLPVAPLADGATRDKLKWAMSDPECLRPGETRQTVTEGSARRRTSRSLRKAAGPGQ